MNYLPQELQARHIWRISWTCLSSSLEHPCINLKISTLHWTPHKEKGTSHQIYPGAASAAAPIFNTIKDLFPPVWALLHHNPSLFQMNDIKGDHITRRVQIGQEVAKIHPNPPQSKKKCTCHNAYTAKDLEPPVWPHFSPCSFSLPPDWYRKMKSPQ